jgi:hypothetical protein
MSIGSADAFYVLYFTLSFLVGVLIFSRQLLWYEHSLVDIIPYDCLIIHCPYDYALLKWMNEQDTF